MKANAPEKLYFFEGETILSARSKKIEDANIEYIRTDTFIDKACEFISLNVTDYVDVTHKGGIEHLALQERFIDNFRKYMEGE